MDSDDHGPSPMYVPEIVGASFGSAIIIGTARCQGLSWAPHMYNIIDEGRSFVDVKSLKYGRCAQACLFPACCRLTLYILTLVPTITGPVTLTGIHEGVEVLSSS